MGGWNPIDDIIDIIDDIVERVEEDIMPQVQKYQRYIPGL